MSVRETRRSSTPGEMLWWRWPPARRRRDRRSAVSAAPRRQVGFGRPGSASWPERTFPRRNRRAARRQALCRRPAQAARPTHGVSPWRAGEFAKPHACPRRLPPKRIVSARRPDRAHGFRTSLKKSSALPVRRLDGPAHTRPRRPARPGMRGSSAADRREAPSRRSVPLAGGSRVAECGMASAIAVVLGDFSERSLDVRVSAPISTTRCPLHPESSSTPSGRSKASVPTAAC